MDDTLATLTGLLEDHRRAVDILNRYKVLNDTKSEQLVARQDVDIQVQDPARTSATPVPVKNFQKISLGSLVSLGVALFVVFGLEFFARRIRFKRDIEEELGLRVVGTVPEK